MLDPNKGFKYSIGAGFSAALAATFGKLAMNEIFLRRWLQNAFIPEGAFFNTLLIILRAISFVLIFIANAVMLNLFTKAMNYFGSVNAVVVNTACNFFFTAIFGYFCFHESLSLQWWFGASVIIIGILLMLRGTPRDNLIE